MSAAIPMPKPRGVDPPEGQPEGGKEKRRFGFGRKKQESKPPKESKRLKAAKPPKPKKVRRPPGIAPLLVLSALLTGVTALAIFYYLPSIEPTTEPESPPATAPPVVSPALLEREASLARKEAELSALEADLQEKRLEVERLVRDLGVTESQNAALLRTAKLYVAMPPYKAAPLMAELQDGTVVQVLKLMTVEEAAAILSAMEPDRSARLMRELATPPTTNPAGE